MIFYFSATGNNKYVAERIAGSANDKVVSITQSVKNCEFDFEVQENENIGFVTPTYFGGLPTVVVDFIKRLKIKNINNNYVFHLLTFGTTTGQAHAQMKEYLKEKGLQLNGKYIVRMVDTWTPMFDLTNKAKNETILEKAERKIDKVIERIVSKENGDFNNRKIPLFGRMIYNSGYKNGKTTKNFTVDSSCISCGLCAKQCPVSAIEIKDKKPVWTKEKCACCLGCLHRCPRFSIQYGKTTRKHGQYVNPKVKL